MTCIREQKLLYHLTSLNNLGSILDNDLQPRSALNGFHDVADVEILAGRAEHGLDDYVPFHWFSRNPFDGRVQTDRPDEDFVLLTVYRTLAIAQNWRVLPKHPLARQEFRFYDYQEGFDLIDWELMDTRDYSDADCKSVCMAECLAPVYVRVADFFKIYVPTERIHQVVLGELTKRRVNLNVAVNQGMFC
ncbi:DarT ssDNA thymidine ADP-ribosyltransferase family protein [Halovibrio sp. HP20-50]|uniref:DarT ssDNA thymidine ADP-ribosyltransferase family protein n=1 Tax=Halovibrio sp. HP20-59 TaxID=3080275 RepID=UPI00294B2BA3|nr:DarT ssDNA thymidine ADP-ribosyltransferase family protein [Halovibrio sp. HP20-59]MEA2118689.1 DarT ssDNA thymidine ADP-ribosyltransferase family protein [Halovibrio sp. HP20-59]